jgi:hypothetical protein
LNTALTIDCARSLRAGGDERHNTLVTPTAAAPIGVDVQLPAHFSTCRADKFALRAYDVIKVAAEPETLPPTCRVAPPFTRLYRPTRVPRSLHA